MSRISVHTIRLLWTALFTVATTLMVGFGSGLLINAKLREGETPDTMAGLASRMGFIWALAPLFGLGVGALLCAFGWLPGTKLVDPKPIDPAK